MDTFDKYGRQQAALSFISDLISNHHKMTLYYGTYERLRGVVHLDTSTLYKIIGIMQNKNFLEGKFMSKLCAGTDGPKSYAKARIDSLYHFMPLTDEYKVDVNTLYAVLRGLPHNRKRFVNCSLPVRRNEVEAFLRFTLELLNSSHRNGISVLNNSEIRLNSDELCSLIVKHQHDMERLIELFCRQGIPLGRVLECLDAPAALQEGAL